MSIKELLGLVATLIALVSFIFYFRGILAGTTKPHAFSWLVWGVLTSIGFFGQYAGHGGWGAWATGGDALGCLIVAAYAARYGLREIAKSDWLSLAGAGFALFLWYLTSNPLAAIILVAFIDACGFWPTFRKSYLKPNQETLTTYLLSAVKYSIALFALDQFSMVTAFYPAALVLINGAFVIFLLIRRRHQA